jgi:hypothetical protein
MSHLQQEAKTGKRFSERLADLEKHTIQREGVETSAVSLRCGSPQVGR